MVWIDPEALVCAARLVQECWGGTGYAITQVEGGRDGSVLAEVTAGDGSRFWVASTRWGNTLHADTREEVAAHLAAKVREESRP